MIKLTLYGKPITKKNSMRIISCAGKPRLIQSKAYLQYEEDCLKQITGDMKKGIDVPIAVTCLYWLKDKRIPDLLNLMASSHDLLQKAGIIKDDALIMSVDGSRIMGVDRVNQR